MISNESNKHEFLLNEFEKIKEKHIDEIKSFQYTERLCYYAINKNCIALI
jgi:hypothetical protein